MKLLVCTPYALRREFGAPKIVIELAEELRGLGWECDLMGREAIERSGMPYHEALRYYLRDTAGRYDVVEYDHQYLPFPRSEFPGRTLFVARSSLLAQHFMRIPIPAMNWRERTARLRDWAGRRRRTAMARRTVVEADLMNVANTGDREELVRCGVPAEKIVLLPYGIDRARRPLFDAIPTAVPSGAKIAFIGSFDSRKGGADFPRIVAELVERNPAVRVKLLGTQGIYSTAEQVLAYFPSRLRPHLEVIPGYEADRLPELLADCSVGIFPSYIESFGFGVIEMLAAAVPVVAYECPGPSDILSREFLVRAGDVAGMAEKVTALLMDPSRLATAREAARVRSRDFEWSAIARATSEAYRAAWEKRQ